MPQPGLRSWSRFFEIGTDLMTTSIEVLSVYEEAVVEETAMAAKETMVPLLEMLASEEMVALLMLGQTS